MDEGSDGIHVRTFLCSAAHKLACKHAADGDCHSQDVQILDDEIPVHFASLILMRRSY
jgi:hypothetical protein